MKIQDVERQTGLDRATIRFYEKEGLIAPGRAENGYRSYSEEDVQLLLKVKLLRQLGVSLNKIKNLQQGSEEFSQILKEQIEILEQRIQENTRAKLVCREMQQDGVQFLTLDSQHYLTMLSAASTQVSHSFCEPIKRESHPWRRYFARMLDYRIITAILQLFLITVIRIRPFESDMIELLNIAAYFVAVPILAAFDHYLGTTPGKWAMGIRLENVNGGKLSGGEALYREGKIIWHGLGFFIPLLELWRIYRSYRDETEGIPQVWNEDTEIIYTPWNSVKKCAFAAICALTMLLSIFAALDSYLPTHRGTGITLEEFAENHRDYEKILNMESGYTLGDDGRWESNPYYIDSSDCERPNFVYEIDKNNKLSSILYAESSESTYPEYILPKHCEAAIYALIGSKSGSSYKDIESINELLESEWYSKLPQQGGENKGSFTIEGVTVNWETNIENCKFIVDGILFAADDSVLSYNLELEILIGS